MAKYLINYKNQKSKISKDIYGNFSEHLGRCIYDGLWVGKDSPIPNINGVRKDVIEALKAIKLPVLRWPGGCFADQYHWKDAIGPQSERKGIQNKTWGDINEDNSFGTHEFMDMCEEIGCDVYLAGNLGTGSIQEMVDWVDYITSDGNSDMAQLRRKNGREKPWNLKYFGIGNEVWGCGGEMTSDYYANLYRHVYHFVSAKTFMDTSSTKFIASGPSSGDYEWTDDVTKNLSQQTKPMSVVKSGAITDGLSMHHYCFAMAPGAKGFFDLLTAEDFREDEWYDLLYKAAEMEELIVKNDVIMTKYDPDKNIGLMVDEWGSWFRSEPGTNPHFLFQQNTLRDAVLAAITLNIFNKHSDRVKLATIAQMINVLQSVILTEGEKMVLTPTYYVFHLFKEHMDATLLDTFMETEKIGTGKNLIDNLFESSSVDADGNITVTICNTSMTANQNVDATLYGVVAESAEAEILVSGDPHDCNTFEEPCKVGLKQHAVNLTENGFYMEVPAASVIRVRIQVKA